LQVSPIKAVMVHVVPTDQVIRISDSTRVEAIRHQQQSSVLDSTGGEHDHRCPHFAAASSRPDASHSHDPVSYSDLTLPATDDVLVFVCVWVDPAASDETAVRRANREAVRKAIEVAVRGRDPEAAASLVARRDEVTSPFYSGAP